MFLEDSVLLNKKTLINEKGFSDNWKIIKDLILTDVKKSLMIFDDDNMKIMEMDLDKEDLDKINELEDLFLSIFSLNSFICDKGFNRTESDKEYINRYIKDITNFGKKEKIETYKTKKGVTRTKQMRKGLIIKEYKEILIKMKKELEELIKNYYSSNSEDKTNKFVEGTYKLNNILNEAQEIRNKDYMLIYNKLTIAFNIYDFIFKISKNLNENNINEQYNKISNYYQESIKELTHDELYQLYISRNKIKQIDFNKLNLNKGKVSNLSINSDLFIKCKEILQLKISAHQRQLLLEEFILSYEKEYTLNLIKNMNNTVQDYKLLTRIYKHSTPQFEERIKIFIENNKKKNYALYYQNRDNICKLGDILALGLFLLIDSNQLINIIFSKVVRLIGQSGGVTQNELLGTLTEEMLIVFKYKLKKIDDSTLNNYNQVEKEIIMLIMNKFQDLTIETKYKFGDLLLELILEEFNYIFIKNSIFSKNEHHIYISISPEYLAILTGSIFNPVRLPMINPPKNWQYKIDTETNKVSKFTQIGGYYLDEYNELNKNNKLIRENNFNKFESLISEDQINTINFLNSKAFEINKETLDFIIKEWENKEDSTLFKGFNKFHTLTYEYGKVNSAIKKEILSHNSKYWSYTNVINIALLLKDETLYFPTFFDFRGRIYPSPNYLSYQSSDLARSLLLFKDVPKNIDTSNQTSMETSSDIKYKDILIQILQSDVYDFNSKNKNMKVKDSKLKDIDYFKLYLANTFGKDKLTRINKLNWVNKNIDLIINEYENDLDTFKNNYLLNSKEPFQFLSCIITYINYIKYKKEIKLPILFDASCSGVQHLSALTTDKKIAQLVNLLNNDSPSDFYQYCIDEFIKVIYSIPDNGKLIELKQKFLKLKITRKWLKNSIMTIPYNVTNIGIVEKLEKKFEKFLIAEADFNKLKNGELSLIQLIGDLKKLKSTVQNSSTEYNEKKSNKENKHHYIFVPVIDILNNKNEDTLFFTSSDLINLAKLLKTTVLSIIPPFNQLKVYFDKIINILDKLGLPLYWETPAGMSVSMSNRIMQSKQIKTNLLKRSKPISILIPTDQIDYKNIKTGMMPNFIHSLDASNIHKLVNNLKLLDLENINLYTIHDCFASDYKNIALIELLVKHSFIELYFKNNYLEYVHETFLRQISQKNDIYTKTTIINNLEVEVKYIIIPSSNSSFNYKIETIYIPELPNYNWSINKEFIKKELLFSSYFIA
uniref:DNA-directed RNA polymerase n=1 Tax=Termitomyces sp. T8 TaxID=2832304 RepID=A0A8F1AC06_9AGAR|nr:RNA polymerase [Termitomyces sp. T8]